MDNPNCGRCGHLNMRGYCNLTTCIFPMTKTEVLNIKKPLTNADRIRSMTDEELAEYFDGLCHDLWQMFVKDPQKMWLEWLKEESNED